MKRLVFACALIAMASQASSATLEEMLAQQQADLKKIKPGFVATTWAPVNTSLSDLLNSGWSIVGGAMAVGLTLRKDTKWLVCEVDDGRAFGSPPASGCYALN